MDTPTQNNPTPAFEKFNFGKYFLNALISFLVIAIGYLFIMPWNIWTSATKRLALLREGGGIIENLTKTEFIILNWLRLFFDALTFIVYVLGPVYIIYSAIDSYSYSFQQFIISLLGIYFSPIFIALSRELLSLTLVMAMKLEEIAKNTSKQ